jgi:hypothetical protein
VGKSGLRSTISEKQGKDMHFKISLSCGPKNGLSRSNKYFNRIISWRLAMNVEKKFLDVDELSVYLGVSKNTILVDDYEKNSVQ